MSIRLWFFSQEKPENEVGKSMQAGNGTSFHSHFLVGNFAFYKKSQMPDLAENWHSRLTFASVGDLAQK